MSARATAWAHAQRVGNSVRKLVLLAIADACNDEGFGFPSMRRISWMAECGERTAQRAIKDLESSKLLEVQRDRTRDAGGGQTSNGYQLLISAPKLQLEGGGVSLTPPSERRPAGCVTPYEQHSSSKNVFISKGKGKKQTPTTLPEDFVISERVRAWAAEKGFDQLEQHLECFVSTCKAKGYRYVDWDEAFMNAVRKDWADIRTPRKAATRGGGSQADRNRRAADEFVRSQQESGS
jgi:hypothetical protein